MLPGEVYQTSLAIDFMPSVSKASSRGGLHGVNSLVKLLKLLRGEVIDIRAKLSSLSAQMSKELRCREVFLAKAKLLQHFL
jgi:hypothetical protein